jgi:sorting nexin-4
MIKVQPSIPFQLQDAVTTAQETSDAFSDETLREQAVFQFAKEAEMKEMLGNLAKGEIEFYTTVGVLGVHH